MIKGKFLWEDWVILSMSASNNRESAQLQIYKKGLSKRTVYT